jgi:prepilin-type N-terminal cleavage/methylation domain-containing protein
MTISTPRNRRGFTLVELLIVMVILGVVGAAFVRALTSASRVSQAQAEKSNMQANLRAGGGLLPSELREINIDASGSDLISISPTSITYWAMRRTALACAGTSSSRVVLRNTNNFGVANIKAGDRVQVFVEGDPGTSSDDAWQWFTVTGTAAGACADGAAATLVNVSGTVPWASLLTDAPVRSEELMTLSIYSADGRWWLGAATNGGSVEPVLGPLAASDSTFGFRTADGSVTTTPSNVRVIEAVLHGETSNAISKSGYDTRQLNQDSLKIRVRLRNAP